MKECFNSQRDGILLWYSYLAYPSHGVSIPNGMEFYKAARMISSSWMSFNSQRDGILPNEETKKAVELYVFQFPTGWNSTRRLHWSRLLAFGFNSQRDGILPSRSLFIARLSFCFNSQRDGILRKGGECGICELCVSIPNGMEFYPFFPFVW